MTLDVVIAWPTAIYTVLLGVVVLYWLLALIGLIDFEHGPHFGDHDVDGHGHVDAPSDGQQDISGIASLVMAFGLTGVPISVVVSLLVLCAWLFTALAARYLLPWVPTDLLRFLAGLLVLLLAFALALVVTARLVRPLRRVFVQHLARSNQSLVGQFCRVTTLTVGERFGQAEVVNAGSSFNIRIGAAEPNTLSKGARALVVDYDAASGRYRVEPTAAE